MQNFTITIPPLICGEDPAILFGLQPHLDRKPCNFTAKTFFFVFGRHLFLDRKIVTPRNSAPGATIPNKASDVIFAR